MKKLTALVIVITGMLIYAGNLSAQHSGTGIGFILVEPTGLSLKTWLSSRSALVLGAAWSLDTDTWHVHADVVKHSFSLRAGIRFPLGINYFFKKVPLDLFFEFVPVFDFIPDTNLRFQGGFGLRYFF
jgi:hypothetical protein